MGMNSCLRRIRNRQSKCIQCPGTLIRHFSQSARGPIDTTGRLLCVCLQPGGDEGVIEEYSTAIDIGDDGATRGESGRGIGAFDVVSKNGEFCAEGKNAG